MGFKIEEVEECPVTRGSSGVLTMAPADIAMIAGAVRDKIEWMVLLHGERSTDGYEVKVSGFTVPEQYRTAGEVELAKDITLPENCVGVMHSHHRMGAFFSTTDTNELNPRFPCSIVVAVANNNLGFNYRACGKVVLPCGAMGIVEFQLAVEGVERFAAEAIRGQHDDLSVKELKGCTHRQYTAHPEDEYLAVDQTACGLSVGEVIERPMVFGMTGTQLIKIVEEQTRTPNRQLPAHYQNYGGYKPGETYWERRKREQQEAQAALSAIDQAKRGGKRNKKRKHRNGLNKLERPTANANRAIEAQCDGCGFHDRVTWIGEMSQHLCDLCLEDLADELLANEMPGTDDRTVVVVDEIEMDQVNGWGV